MMLQRKQPSTAAPLTIRHIAAGLRAMTDRDGIAAFERDFASWNGSAHAIAAGSGTTALYAALAAMKVMRPERDEVILPAYTVPTLTLALNRAGLKTVLCDVARDTFNMDAASLAAAVTGRTLAIVPVHMFGVPCALGDILAIGRERGIFVLEDACQSPGAKLGGVRVGALGDAGFFSFCKGKNLTAFHGGMIVTSNADLAVNMRIMMDALPPRGMVYRAAAPALVTALALAMRPVVYGAGYRFIARFKSTEVHEEFHPARWNRFMAGAAHAQLDALDRWNAVRTANARAIRDAIEDDDGLVFPREPEGAEPVYNHLPVVFRDIGRLERAQRRLWERGIDTGRMYERPIHHIYPWVERPAGEEPYPAAAWIAPRLLTLPTHPYLGKRDVEMVVEGVRG